MCIRKKWNIISLVMVLLITMTGCSSEKMNSILSEISKTIGVDVSAGEVISESDSHGGFHGDGDTVIEIQCADTSFSDQLEENEEWNAMPLTENLTTLVYGIHTETSSIGPMIHSGDNVPVIPEIENGYYYFKDRHHESMEWNDDTNIQLNTDVPGGTQVAYAEFPQENSFMGYALTPRILI